MKDHEIIKQIEDALEAAAKDPAQKARIDAWLQSRFAKTQTEGDRAPASSPLDALREIIYIPPPPPMNPYHHERPWPPPFEVWCGDHPVHIATGGLIGKDSWQASITNTYAALTIDPNGQYRTVEYAIDNDGFGYRLH